MDYETFIIWVGESLLNIVDPGFLLGHFLASSEHILREMSRNTDRQICTKYRVDQSRLSSIGLID